MDLPHKEITSLRWASDVWRVANGARGALAGGAPSEFRLATMNILTETFPWPVRLAIGSEERYKKLITEISRLDATILGLNEVSQMSLQMLLDSEFVRANYYVTELPSNVNTTLNGPHGCVLLSKLPFEACYALEPHPSKPRPELQFRKPVVGVMQVAGQRIAVCSLHTLAYQSPGNMTVRAQQIQQAVSFLQGLDVQARFVMGDLNMHYVAEDAVIINNGLLDCWAETHFGSEGDAHPGYTFDASNNKMIPRYIPGETRCMRLDRILCCEGGAFAPVRPCSIWGDEAIDAARDLYLSDHYGLYVDLALAPEGGFRGKSDVRQVLEANSQRDLEPNPSSWLSLALAIIQHVPWLSLRLFGLR